MPETFYKPSCQLLETLCQINVLLQVRRYCLNGVLVSTTDEAETEKRLFPLSLRQIHDVFRKGVHALVKRRVWYWEMAWSWWSRKLRDPLWFLQHLAVHHHAARVDQQGVDQLEGEHIYRRWVGVPRLLTNPKPLEDFVAECWSQNAARLFLHRQRTWT